VPRLKILITIKTYPIPSKKYDELVCTAGVTESGDFIRLYPINFRELDYARQYRKYQWMEVEAEKHTGRDVRKESIGRIQIRYEWLENRSEQTRVFGLLVLDMLLPKSQLPWRTWPSSKKATAHPWAYLGRKKSAIS